MYDREEAAYIITADSILGTYRIVFHLIPMTIESILVRKAYDVSSPLLHCPRPNPIHILIRTHVLDNAQRNGRLPIPQQFKHLRTHFPHLTPGNGQELILLCAEVAPAKEQAVHRPEGVGDRVVAAAVVSGGEEDQSRSTGHFLFVVIVVSVYI